jgi:hypothetical protein
MNTTARLVISLVCVFTSWIQAAEFRIEIQRKYSGTDCVSGYLLVNDKAVCYVLEKPWLGNLPEISAIPPGTYNANIRTDGTKGWRIELSNVPDRTNVQIHVGNTTADSRGCMLPGKSIDNSLCKVTNSKEAMELLRVALEKWQADLQQSVAITVKITH